MSNIDLVQLTEQTKKLTAMVVEDEGVANELLSSTFGNFFSDVTSAFNGEEALKLYQEKKPDIVFVDIIMPVMDGIELSRRIREINPNQIIIVISASNDIQKISESIEIGVNSFIQKPIDTKKIIELLTNVTSMISRKKKIETKTFSISLPYDLYELVDDNAKAESISKNAVIIRALRDFYKQ
jgi:YesN/AraC family two-component response regulator